MKNVGFDKKKQNMLKDKKQSTYTVALFIVDEQYRSVYNLVTIYICNMLPIEKKIPRVAMVTNTYTVKTSEIRTPP